MSAFICSDRHIATIAHFVANGDLEFAQHIADSLKRENVRAYNKRYGHKTRAKPCNVSDFWKEASAADICALCDCLDYQFSEESDFSLLSSIRNLSFRISGGKVSGLWSI